MRVRMPEYPDEREGWSSEEKHAGNGSSGKGPAWVSEGVDEMRL
jgi:hypothetical protein